MTTEFVARILIGLNAGPEDGSSTRDALWNDLEGLRLDDFPNYEVEVLSLTRFVKEPEWDEETPWPDEPCDYWFYGDMAGGDNLGLHLIRFAKSSTGHTVAFYGAILIRHACARGRWKKADIASMPLPLVPPKCSVSGCIKDSTHQCPECGAWVCEAHEVTYYPAEENTRLKGACSVCRPKEQEDD